MKLFDAKGMECPKPVIETKKILIKYPGESVVTVVDNQTSAENLKKLAQSMGYNSKCTEKEKGIFEVLFTKGENQENIQDTDEDKLKIQPTNDTLTIVITSNLLGTGADELGATLMKSYIYALTETDKKPSSLIFINSGVFFTVKDSPVLTCLEELASSGTEILSCGACLNFYNLTESLAVGSVTNMYAIAEKMNNSSNTIKI